MAIRSVPWARTCSDTISWRQDQALAATIYILRQTGPTGFLLKEEDQPKKFKVFLGDPHSCTCPDFRKEKEGLCKHICWLILRKFRVPRQNPITWQRGLVDRELNEILRGLAARQETRQTTQTRKYAALAQKTADEGGKTVIEQREIGEDDVCPICQDELLAKRLPVTHCKFGCGNSVHIKCMKVWAEHQQSQGKNMIECPFCREDFGPMNLLQQEFRNAGRDARADRLNEHLGVTCNKCHVCPIAGKCYRCNVCADFHLCPKCFNTPTHPDHAFSFRQRANQRWRPAPRSQSTVLPDAVVSNLMNRDISEQDYDMLLQLDSNTAAEGSDLSEDTIRLFPLERVRPNGLLMHPGEQCRVCLRPYQEGQFVRRLPCRHKFHRECIDNWLLHRRPTCPVDGTTYTNNSVRTIMEANRERSRRQAEENSRQQTSNTNSRGQVQTGSGPALVIPGIGIARMHNEQSANQDEAGLSQENLPSNQGSNSQVRSDMGGFFGIFQGRTVRHNNNRSQAGRGGRKTHVQSRLPNSRQTGNGVTLGNVANGIDTILTHSRASSSTRSIGNVSDVTRDVIASLYGRGLSTEHLQHYITEDTNGIESADLISAVSQVQDNELSTSNSGGGTHDIDSGISGLSVTSSGLGTRHVGQSEEGRTFNTSGHNRQADRRNSRTEGTQNTNQTTSENGTNSGISSLMVTNSGTRGSNSEIERRAEQIGGRPSRGSGQRRQEQTTNVEPQAPSIPLARSNVDLALGGDRESGNAGGPAGRPPVHTDTRSGGRLRNRPLYREPGTRGSGRGRKERSRSRERPTITAENSRNASSLYVGHDPSSVPGFTSNFTLQQSSAPKRRPSGQDRQHTDQSADAALAPDLSLAGSTFSAG